MAPNHAPQKGRKPVREQPFLGLGALQTVDGVEPWPLGTQERQWVRTPIGVEYVRRITAVSLSNPPALTRSFVLPVMAGAFFPLSDSKRQSDQDRDGEKGAAIRDRLRAGGSGPGTVVIAGPQDVADRRHSLVQDGKDRLRGRRRPAIRYPGHTQRERRSAPRPHRQLAFHRGRTDRSHRPVPFLRWHLQPFPDPAPPYFLGGTRYRPLSDHRRGAANQRCRSRLHRVSRPAPQENLTTCCQRVDSRDQKIFGNLHNCISHCYYIEKRMINLHTDFIMLVMTQHDIPAPPDSTPPRRSGKLSVTKP